MTAIVGVVGPRVGGSLASVGYGALATERLQIVAVGRIRPPHVEAAHEYESRIAARTTFRVDEVAAEPLQHGSDQVDVRDGARVLGRVIEGAYVVALDPRGRPHVSSEAFAEWLGRRVEAPTTTAFVIGGASGLPMSVRARSDELLSLGPMTLPHQLARVVLVEQIYRALCHLAGHPYAH